MDIDEFSQLFPDHTNTELAEKYGVSVSTIGIWARNAGLRKSPEHWGRMQAQRNRDKVWTPEMRQKLSASCMGRPMLQEARDKAQRTKTANNSQVSGPKHWNWNGGRPRWHRYEDPRYEPWRFSVFERDKYVCQCCKRKCNKNEKGLAAHHIKSYTDFPDFRYDLDNGMTLCRRCHMAVHGTALGPPTMIQCACGCGGLRPAKDIYGRPRTYINGHPARGKPKSEKMRHLLSQAKKGRNLTQEHRDAISRGSRKSWAERETNGRKRREGKATQNAFPS